jgi:hypothetical protein
LTGAGYPLKRKSKRLLTEGYRLIGQEVLSKLKLLANGKVIWLILRRTLVKQAALNMFCILIKVRNLGGYRRYQ